VGEPTEKKDRKIAALSFPLLYQAGGPRPALPLPPPAADAHGGTYRCGIPPLQGSFESTGRCGPTSCGSHCWYFISLCTVDGAGFFLVLYLYAKAL